MWTLLNTHALAKGDENYLNECLLFYVLIYIPLRSNVLPMSLL